MQLVGHGIGLQLFRGGGVECTAHGSPARLVNELKKDITLSEHETLYFYCRASSLCDPECRNGVRSDEGVGADGACIPPTLAFCASIPAELGNALTGVRCKSERGWRGIKVGGDHGMTRLLVS